MFSIWWQVFNGNKDNNAVVINSILYPFEARFVRFLPQSWKNSIALRVEVYGEAVGEHLVYRLEVLFYPAFVTLAHLTETHTLSVCKRSLEM